MQNLDHDESDDDYTISAYDSDIENIPPCRTGNPTTTIPSIVISNSDFDNDLDITDSDSEHRAAENTAAPSAALEGLTTMPWPWYVIFDGIYQGVWERA